jgi:hypothetical protein
VALALIAVAAVIIPGRLHRGSSDPGCQAYASTALPAYNNAIEALNNSKSPQGTLGADITTAITDLTSAAQQAQSASAKSALSTMLTELKTVQADVKAGSVPSSVVSALNADSTSADSVCS